MRQLTALDALFLAAENDRTQGHVSSLGVYDPVTASGWPLDAALVRELVSERVHLLHPFRWRLAGVPFGLDHPYWVDEGTVDVEYHVREVALPSPGDQRQLAEQVAHLIGSRLDRARPLWEMYVIHGLQDGAVAVLTKMHHAAVDGVSGAEVMGYQDSLEFGIVVDRAQVDDPWPILDGLRAGLRELRDLADLDASHTPVVSIRRKAATRRTATSCPGRSTTATPFTSIDA